MSCIFLQESPRTHFIASIHVGKQLYICNLTPTVFPAGDTDSLAFNRDCRGEKSDKGKVKTAKEDFSLLMTLKWDTLK